MVVVEITTENLKKCIIVEKGAENDIDEEAFRALAAPVPVGVLAADIAAFEEGVVWLEARVAGENHADLKLGERSQETEIVDFGAQELLDILVKVVFKFVGFGVLMVDFGAVDGGFIGAAFVGHDDIFFIVEISDEIGREGEQGAERSVAVQEALAIETEEFWVDGTLGVDGGIVAGFDAG